MERLAWTVSEIREQTQIGRDAIYAAIKNRELEAIFIGRRIVCRVEDVKKWLKERSVSA